MPYRQQSDGAPGAPTSPPLNTADAPTRELKNTDLHKLSENSWLQFCRDAGLIGATTAPLMPTDVCLIFTAVNTRRAARNLSLGTDAESGSIRAFTFSEFVEGLIQCACKTTPAVGGLLTADHVQMAVTQVRGLDKM